MTLWTHVKIYNSRNLKIRPKPSLEKKCGNQVINMLRVVYNALEAYIENINPRDCGSRIGTLEWMLEQLIDKYEISLGKKNRTISSGKDSSLHLGMAT